MRMVHTSDWHIGKILNDFSLLEDQEYILNQLVDFMIRQRAQLLLVAGDLYDRAIPPTGAVALLDRLLCRLTGEAGIPVIAVGGNHDSPQRIAFANRLVEQSGLYLEGVYRKDIRRVTLQDDYGPLHFYCLPYLEPAQVRADFPEETIRSFDDAFRTVLGHNLPEVDFTERNVLVTHGFFSYLRDPDAVERSDSEISIGGSDLIDASYTDAFDYVALGHLHRAQTAGREHIRYSGSPLKYSLSECGAAKSVTTVDLRQKGVYSIKKLELSPLRDLRVVRGSFAELVRPEQATGNREDYVYAELSDDSLIPGAMERLRGVYPNILGLRLAGRDPEQEARVSAAAEMRGKSPEELFEAFYEAVKKQDLPDSRRRAAGEVMAWVRGGRSDETE